MIEAINVKVLNVENNFLNCALLDIFLRINILQNDKKFFQNQINLANKNQKLKIYVVFNFFSYLNQFLIYGFKNKIEKNLFLQISQIKNINYKSAYKILNNFSLFNLKFLAQNNDCNSFKQKLNFNETKIKAVFKIFNNNFINSLVPFQEFELEIIENLSKIGFAKQNVIACLNKLRNQKNYAQTTFQTKINLLISNLSK